MPESSLNQEFVDQEEEENYENKNEPQEQEKQLVWHFCDSIVQNVESEYPSLGQHAYKTWSKVLEGTPGASRSNSTKVNNTPPPTKQYLPIRNTRMLGLQYDIIEDLKIICGNISMYDLL